jgi:rhamnosyltransferase
MLPTNTICAIVVTYHPDWVVLRTLLEELHPQVGKIIIVDNTATSQLESSLSTLDFYQHIFTINPDKNIGLGAAYNAGFNWAKNNAYEYILLFDQDSCPEDSMVLELYKAHQTLTSKGQKVGVVGPNYIDARTKIASCAIQIDGCTLTRCYCADNKNSPYLRATYLISSGSFIAIKDLMEIGGFDETLFIDYVDIEWGLRARSKGYFSWYICPAILYHRLGDDVVNVFGRSISRHNPLRCFYIFRNAILLSKRTYIPFGWKFLTTFSNIRRYIFYVFFSTTKLQHIKMMSLGIWDGLRGKNGRYTAHL